ncbi:MAG: dienelactone hydrolase family protein [Acidobacteriota bacterium]|nr:dienelactone hydrolase family protein [Acidobacteriota bacterium]
MRLLINLAVYCALAHGAEVPSERLHQHRVSPASPAREPGTENEIIPSLTAGVKDRADWYGRVRPQILARWLTILGKVEPAAGDRKWFADPTKAVAGPTTDEDGYTRTEIELPLESDFFQKHVLLVPKGKGPFPAVICWTSTTPDYKAPEQWWGRWLAGHGYVVLTSWAFIRNYRDGSTYKSGVSEKVYERFGHWLPMGKMVYDARQEARYLVSLGQVDARRIGFMGFSLSGKSAVYVAAFAPEIKATVAIDPQIAVNGSSNWYAPWYLDWLHVFPDIPTPQHTVLSMLDTDPRRPGFEHDHHELLALSAPRPFLLIGGSLEEASANGSDDLESWGYINRAREVYRLLGAEERLQYVSTGDGHHANGPHIDPAWQGFLERFLKPR